MAPPQVICSTVSQHPQTFQPNVGRGYYYNKKFGHDLHGPYVFTNASNFATSADATSLISMRKEAALQGLTDVKVWDCTTSCYSNTFLDQGGQDVEGTYVDVLYLPFLSAAEQKANPMLANFVKYTGKDKADGYGVYAWSAMIAFRDAVNAQVKASGVNSVTRKTIFDQLNQIHEFNADGMFGTIDLAGRKTTRCNVLLQVKDGEFTRVHPTKPGTFDCAKRNVRDVQLDLY
jgi:hypothetical protein